MLADLLDNEEGVSPVIGAVLLIAVAVLLSGLVVFGATTYFDSDEPPQAAANVDYESESVIAVQLADAGNADRVLVRSALGTEYVLENVGDTQEILNIEGEGQMAVIAVKDGERTVVQKIEPQSFDPDYTVGENQEYTSLEAAINDALADGDSNSIVAVKRGTYNVSDLSIPSSVTVVGEDGTVLSDTGSTGPTVTVTGDGRLSNVKVKTNGETSTAVDASDSATLVSVTSDGGDILTSGNATQTESNRLVTITGSDQPTGTAQVSLKEITVNNTYTSKTTVLKNKSIRRLNLTVTTKNDQRYFGSKFYLVNSSGDIVFGFLQKQERVENGTRVYTVKDGKISESVWLDDYSSTVTIQLIYDNGDITVKYQGEVVLRDSGYDIDEILVWKLQESQYTEVNGSVYVEQ